jgi:hypothetical protein
MATRSWPFMMNRSMARPTPWDAEGSSPQGVPDVSIEFLYYRSEVLITLGLLVLLGLAGVAGHRIGRRSRRGDTEINRSQVLAITAALLGLLSLLLGFTFAMALSRFEYRKELVVEESNAIGTAALRSQFLPVSSDAEMNALFRRYVAIRLESVLETTADSEARDDLDDEVRRIQRRLWSIAGGVAKSEPQSVPLGLFALSVNALIDVKARRDVAVANHVPEGAILFLMGMAGLAVAFLGYGDGLTGSRSRTPTAAFSLIVALVILLIIDLDRPQRGLTRVSQGSMQQVQEILDVGRR